MRRDQSMVVVLLFALLVVGAGKLGKTFLNVLSCEVNVVFSAVIEVHDAHPVFIWAAISKPSAL